MISELQLYYIIQKWWHEDALHLFIYHIKHVFCYWRGGGGVLVPDLITFSECSCVIFPSSSLWLDPLRRRSVTVKLAAERAFLVTVCIISLWRFVSRWKTHLWWFSELSFPPTNPNHSDLFSHLEWFLKVDHRYMMRIPYRIFYGGFCYSFGNWVFPYIPVSHLPGHLFSKWKTLGYSWNGKRMEY